MTFPSPWLPSQHEIVSVHIILVFTSHEKLLLLAFFFLNKLFFFFKVKLCLKKYWPQAQKVLHKFICDEWLILMLFGYLSELNKHTW